MVVHHETRQLPVYELVVAKGGPKLKESADIPSPAPALAPPPAPGPPTPVFPVLKYDVDRDGLRELAPGSGTALVMMSLGGAKARYSARQYAISDLVRVMQSTVRHPVVDKTGLTGKYDFNLDFTQDDQTRATAPPPADNPAELGPPDLFTALQQQLGLKLDEKKGPVDVLVVDRAEKTPSEN
jgi:uncharacterized protein (TIGR03435 family)